jgi:hypothetical protein
MRVLGPIVQILRLSMFPEGISTRWAGRSLASLSVTSSRATYRRAVSSGRTNFMAATAFRRDCTRNVEHIAVLVDRAPQDVDGAVDLR